jgi:hypothetical protein
MRDCEGMGLIRADLCERLAALRRLAERHGNLAASIGAIRTHAAAYGLEPVVRLAEAFERAVADGRGQAHAGLYLDRLHDAIGCQSPDATAAAEAMIASVSVRLGA